MHVVLPCTLLQGCDWWQRKKKLIKRYLVSKRHIGMATMCYHNARCAETASRRVQCGYTFSRCPASVCWHADLRENLLDYTWFGFCLEEWRLDLVTEYCDGSRVFLSQPFVFLYIEFFRNAEPISETRRSREYSSLGDQGPVNMSSRIAAFRSP